jgi:hypothetical protein
MSEKAEAKFERLVSEDSDRRRSEVDALIWKISISGITGDLEGTYDPQPAMDWLEKIFKSNYQPSPGEVSSYVEQHNVHARTAKAALREIWVGEKVKEARHQLHSMLFKALSDTLYLLVSDDVPSKMLSKTARVKFVERQARRRAAAFRKARIGLENRGRKAEWEKNELMMALLKARHEFTRTHYRNPTLRDMAATLSERYPVKGVMTADALRMTLKRVGIIWKSVKNRTK